MANFKHAKKNQEDDEPERGKQQHRALLDGLGLMLQPASLRDMIRQD